MGLEDGDEILWINGYRILDWIDLIYVINDMEVGFDIEIVVWWGRGWIEWFYFIQLCCVYEVNKAIVIVCIIEKQENKYFDIYIKDWNGWKLFS